MPYVHGPGGPDGGGRYAADVEPGPVDLAGPDPAVTGEILPALGLAPDGRPPGRIASLGRPRALRR